ncbi:hypothetical protein CPB84DRAFT_1798646 [Gymnopilus junonius]|uniref:Uncharacterized protein n=1 Tax=Gymnopilus junonius TaxID=109634 RepID=A0A9P5NAI9_GYMJU|nr:hypothetical protein CPB84DRAFT_1798646 [Gymnopilus junonius]
MLTLSQGLFFLFLSFLLILVGAHIPFTTAIHLSLLYSDHHLTRLHPPPLPLQSKFMSMIITLYASSVLHPPPPRPPRPPIVVVVFFFDVDSFFTETDLFFILGYLLHTVHTFFIHLFIYYY